MFFFEVFKKDVLYFLSSISVVSAKTRSNVWVYLPVIISKEKCFVIGKENAIYACQNIDKGRFDLLAVRVTHHV